MRKQLTLFLWLCLLSTPIWAQTGYQTLPLNDLSSFRPQAGNWMVVGGVTMDPSRSIHHEQPAEETGKKKKKSTGPEWIHPVQYTAGQGILLNFNDDQKKR